MSHPLKQTEVGASIARLRRRNPQYTESAYFFVLAALQRELDSHERPRHVAGPELADSVRDLALDSFGLMARTVLEHWGIHSTSDLGNIVFLLVESGVLIKEDADSPDDFEGLYSFEEAFEEEYPWNG